MAFNWLRQMRRRLTGKSHGLKRANCLKRSSPARSESLEERKVMTAAPIAAEISEAALAKAPDLPSAPTGAPILAGDTTLVGQLQVSKDQDVVRLPVQANQIYRIDLSVTGIVGGKVEIKSADGKTTLATGVVKSDGQVSLEWKALKTELVSLRVFSTNNKATGSYRLTTTRIVDDVEDTAGTARVLNPNEGFEGRLDHTKDQDWFQIAVTKGEVLLLKFESHDLSGAKLTVFDAAGKKALKSFTPAVGMASEIEWTSDRTGTISLQVLSTTKSLGSYTLATERIGDDHSGAAAQATILTLGEPIEGSLQFNQDIDWLRFRAEAGKAYVLKWSSEAGEASEISLYRGTSAKPVATESLQEDGPGQVEFVATESTDYVVKISRPGIGTVSAGFRAVASPVNYTVGIEAQNEPPRANPLDPVNVEEDSDEVVIDLTEVFVDPDPDDTLTLTIEDNSNPDVVSAELGDDGQLRLTFAPNQHGLAIIRLRATDSHGEFVEIELPVTVESVNDDPILIEPIEDIVVDQDSEDVLIDLSEHFEDVDVDDELNFEVIDNSNSEVVTATVERNVLRLSFAPGRSGPVSITLLASDLEGAGVQTSFNVEVERPNKPPFVGRELEPIEVYEDADDEVVDISDVFVDPDPDDVLELSVGDNSNPDVVTAYIENGQLRLSFAPNQHGSVTLTLVATDIEGLTAETTLEITVISVNDAPEVVQPLDDVVVEEDADDIVVEIADTFADVDVDDLLFFSLEDNSNPDLVTAYLEDGRLMLSFTPNGNGDATITLRATDLEGLTVETTLNVSVTPVNDAPEVVAPIEIDEVDEDSEEMFIDLDQVFADVDFLWEGDELQFEVTDNSGTSLVEATVEGNWLRLQFAPNANGGATLKLRATDGAGEWVETSFDLIVNPVNDAPEAAALPEEIGLGDPGVVVIDLSEAFFDVDGDELDYSIEDESGVQPEFAWIEDGKLYLRIDGSNSGTHELTIVATDPIGESARLTFLWSVLETLSLDVIKNGEIEVPLLEGQLAEFSQPENGTLVQSEDDPNVLIYTPNEDYIGPETIYYRAMQDDGSWSVGVIELDVVDISAPTLDDVTDVDHDSAIITWEAASGSPSEYRVEIYENVDGEWVLNEQLSQTILAEDALKVELTDLTAGTVYQVIVTAVYADLGQELASETKEFTTTELELTPPTGLTPGEVGTHEITVGWDAVEDERVTGYVIEIYDAANDRLIGSQQVGPDELETTFTGLRANYTYRFTLRAEYDGELVEGESIDVRTEQVYQAPEVEIIDIKYQKATVTWSDPGWGPKGYSVDLEKYDAATGEWKPVTSQHQWKWANETRSVEFLNLNSDSLYRVTVTAKNSDRGIERKSGPIEFTTLAFEAPIVTVDGVSYHQAKATWTAPGWNVKGYSIDVEQLVGGNWVRIERLHDWEWASDPRQQNFDTLPAGAHLRIVVTAKNNDTMNVERVGLSREFDTPALTATPNVKVTNVGSTNATVSWDKVAWPVQHYRVEYRVTGSNAWTSGGTQPANQSSQLVVNGLKPSTSYEFRVVAVGSVLGDQVSSPTTPPVTTPPLALNAPIVTVIEVGRSNAIITWTDPGWGPKGYSIDLEKFDKATNSWKPDTAKREWKYATETRRFEFTNLLSETQYRVTVTAKDNDRGIEKSSAAVQFTTLAFPGPTNVRMTEINRSSATVAWNKVEGWQPERYRIEVRNGAGNLVHEGSTAGSNASYEITGLTANTGYCVQVIAVNDSPVLKKASSSLSFQTKAFTAPGSLSYTATKTSITLTWGAVDWNVASYTVQKKNASGNWVDVKTVDGSKTSTQVTNLTAGTNYVFRVVAQNSNATVPGAELSTWTLSNTPVGASSRVGDLANGRNTR